VTAFGCGEVTGQEARAARGGRCSTGVRNRPVTGGDTGPAALTTRTPCRRVCGRLWGCLDLPSPTISAAHWAASSTAALGPAIAASRVPLQRPDYGADDPYRVADGTPNKETRVHIVLRAATRRSARARDLVDGILTSLRLSGMFDAERETCDRQAVTTLQRALRREGWDLTDDGLLTTLGEIDLETGGREALDEQLDRLRRSTDDPGALLGSAKDLLEAVANFVLEELGTPQDGEFGHLWYLARDRLGIHPQQVVPDGPASEQIRKILGASWTIAEQVNALRNLQGAGHRAHPAHRGHARDGPDGCQGSLLRRCICPCHP
jgi:hypothetical protein